MANYKPLENFSNLYNRAYAMFNNTYTPQSASTLKDALSRSMRPAYDKQIAARQDAAKANRAAIDTDAASRGMGSSSWVTDVKNRQNNAAASDIANIESDYQANLYNSLLNRLGQQDEMAMAAAQAAQGNALGLANQLYGKVFAKKSGGGGGGWGRRGSRTPDDTETPEDLGDFGNTGNTGTPSTKPRTRENGDQTTPYRRRGVSSGGSGQPRNVNVGMYR